LLPFDNKEATSNGRTQLGSSKWCSVTLKAARTKVSSIISLYRKRNRKREVHLPPPSKETPKILDRDFIATVLEAMRYQNCDSDVLRLAFEDLTNFSFDNPANKTLIV
jgi:hypothetical protein